jgi:tetratricopeptide (TPR) repeat protein
MSRAGLGRVRLFHPIFTLGSVALVVGLAGCQTPTPDSTRMMMGCADSVAAVKESPYKNSRKTELLYYMQLATYEHACREYSQSIENFEAAKQIAEKLYGVSVGETATSFLVNDAMRAYKGQNFERALLRIFNAINYSVLEQWENALVEARQIDYLLSKLNREQGGDNVYDEDAFARYLTGMLYQEAGDIDNANVSYLKALEAYRENEANYGVAIPEPLLAAATEVAHAHSRQAVDRVAEYGEVAPRSLPEGAGEVVLIHQVGLVPKKIEDRYVIAWSDGFAYLNKIHTPDNDPQSRRAIDAAATIASSHSITVAFPKYVLRPYSVRDLEVTAPGALSIGTPALVQNVGRIAVKDLDDQKARIYGKTLARAAFYFALLQVIEKEMRDSGESELMIQVVRGAEKMRQIAFEKADIRYWESLPDQIKLIPIVMPAGDHRLNIRRRGEVAGDPASAIDDFSVTVSAGKRTFVSVRTAS